MIGNRIKLAGSVAANRESGRMDTRVSDSAETEDAFAPKMMIRVGCFLSALVRSLSLPLLVMVRALVVIPERLPSA